MSVLHCEEVDLDSFYEPMLNEIIAYLYYALRIHANVLYQF